MKVPPFLYSAIPLVDLFPSTILSLYLCVAMGTLYTLQPSLSPMGTHSLLYSTPPSFFTTAPQ